MHLRRRARTSLPSSYAAPTRSHRSTSAGRESDCRKSKTTLPRPQSAGSRAGDRPGTRSEEHSLAPAKALRRVRRPDFGTRRVARFPSSASASISLRSAAQPSVSADTIDGRAGKTVSRMSGAFERPLGELEVTGACGVADVFPVAAQEFMEVLEREGFAAVTGALGPALG